MSQPAIMLRGVITADGGTVFDVEVPRHSCVAVIGDEHSGTEELCGVALGVTQPLGGWAEILGERVGEMSVRRALAFRRKLGYLPAGDGLMQNLSLRNNVALPLRFGSDYTDREIDARVELILTALRVVGRADLRPSAVRAEHRRRAAIARALAFDPEVVLLENPFVGITDSAAGELLETLLGGSHKEGSRRTVFMTSHHLPGNLTTRVDRIFRAIKGQLSVER